MKKSLSLLALLLASVSAHAGVIAQDPLFISAQADPRVMLVASRDHQLFIKAYTDYSDLDGDGFLDTNFTPYIEYDGYFNPRKCYTYQNSRFEATAAATVENYTVTLVDAVTTVTKPAYVCSNAWSGNLLNWAAMTRVDVLRKVLYGGYRSTDTESLTVLERAHLPRDVHAFAKVFAAGSNASMNKFTPYADQSTVSFCNLTDDGNNPSKSSTNPPVMQIANGAFRLWAANEHPQCGIGSGTKPAALRETLNVRVKVCDDGGGTDTISGPGPKCKTYLKSGVAKKPIGILQQYGDADATSSLKFGLMTGSWVKNKSGSVLRKNIGGLSNSSGKYPNNYNCATAGDGFVANSSDEIDFCTGVFVNRQGLARSAAATDDLPSTGGIIGTLNRLRLAGWSGSKYDGVCNSPGTTTFANGACIDWGNPISEMYLESLRYLRAADATDKLATDTSAASPTAAFDGSDAAYISGLPQLSWKDPIPAAEWCAKSNIVMVSTGLNSFDTDETAPHELGWPATVETLTNAVGTAEGVPGTFMIGSATAASDYQSVCSSKALGSLFNAEGICPEVPSIEGGYHVAGLARGTALYDLRPGYQTKRQALWGVTRPEYADRQPLSTYTIALAENLPNFTVPVGSGNITFLPFCQANSTGGAGLADSGWRACSMVDLEVESGSTQNKGSFRVMWEDSTWGNDYDMDGVIHLRYCVGSECNVYAGQNGMPAVPATNTLYIKVASMTAAAGHALKYGYTISGSTADGTVLDVLRPGGQNHATYDANSEFTSPVGTWTSPVWVAYSPSVSGSANLLKNPLWYTAKHAAGANWDVKNNATRATGTDGIPDNFFQVRNPAGLDLALSSALRESLGGASSASSIAANSTRLDTDTFIYQARFKALDWSGQVLAYPLTQAGTLGTLAWDSGAADKIPAHGVRRVFSFNRWVTTKGIELDWANLAGSHKAGLDNANAGNSASPILNYLRGDKSQELLDANNDGIYESGIYRPRPTSVFGDVINSDPVFVGNQNYAYGTITAITGYDTYQTQVLKKVDANNSVRNPLVLVNANDGMMHAIDGKNGNEVLTYVPSWLLCPYQGASGVSCFTDAAFSVAGNDASPLRQLTSPSYQHRYMLDGNLAVGDAYIDTGSGTPSWKTVVVGAAAAGGKGVYALDLTATYDGSGTTTTTSDLSETQTAYSNVTAASTSLWEFTDANYGGASANGDADLGYTYGLPVIGRAANGAWVAIFGNGYNSANGKAVLYVVNLATGVLIRKIDVGDGSTAASPNGLSSPAAIFDPATGAFSAIFAGDLKGNLWKFDLTASNPASWGVEHGSGTPLFVARDDSGTRQPITAALEIGTHSSGGYMIYFGTGKYFEKNDDTTTSMQTIYAIWDKTQSNDDISNASTDTAAEKRSVLQEHKIIFEGDNPFYFCSALTNPSADVDGDGWCDCDSNHDGVCDGVGQTKIRVTDDVGAVSYSGGGAKRGWYMNLLVVGGSLLGERVVSAPILRNKRIIFTTIIPNGSPCEFGGTSWIMEFDPLSGNRLSESVFDLNGDGEFTSADYIVITIGGQSVQVPANGVRSTEGMIKSPAIISGGGKEYKISSGTTGNVLVVSEKGSANRARASWRQIR